MSIFKNIQSINLSQPVTIPVAVAQPIENVTNFIVKLALTFLVLSTIGHIYGQSVPKINQAEVNQAVFSNNQKFNLEYVNPK